jgi:methionyl-tRNA formyltransferase
VPSLRALLDSSHEVTVVVTNPDRPAGRGMEVTASPVKRAALDAGVEVMQPAKARDPDFQEALAAVHPEVAVVVAYGKILPASVLAIPRLGFVNVHFSLLPAYRGAAPVQRALMEGVDTTGVSIMVLTEGMDEGPVLAMQSIDVGVNDTAGVVGQRLAEIGAELLVPSLEGYGAGRVQPVPQDDEHATYAPKFGNDEARIDWRNPSPSVHNLVRALNPAPGAWTTFKDTRLKIYETRQTGDGGLEPGGLRAGEKLIAGTGDGSVELVDVQLAGKRRMSGGELARGLRLEPEDRLE